MRDKIHKHLFNLRNGVLVLLTCLLFGCGGGDGENGGQGEGGNSISHPPSPVGKVMAVDGFSAVAPNRTARVDLSNYVRGQGATLTDMYSPQSECRTTRVTGLTAELYVENGQLCHYTFTASDGKTSDSGVLNVLATTSTTPLLPPLSHPMQLGDGPVSFNLPAMLGTDWPAGYQLDPTSIIVVGGDNQGSAAAVPGNPNVIRYEPPTSADWNQIGFILTHPGKPTEDMLGTLYVTVSTTVNSPPTISPVKYNYTQTVYTAALTTINLSSLVELSIKDPEEGPWQLAEVMSYTAAVSPSSATDVENKSFQFTAAVPGEHIVSYIVADHAGGFTSGMMKISVTVNETPKTWSDITVIPDHTYFATPTYNEVLAKGIVPASYNFDSLVKNSIAGLTPEQADLYCGSNGLKIATKADFERLFAWPEITSQLNTYPRQQTYLTIDEFRNYQTFDIKTGAFDTYIPGTTAPQYIICVKLPSDDYMRYIPISDAAVEGYSNMVLSNGETWWRVGEIVSPGGISRLEVIEDDTENLGTIPLTAGNFRLNPSGCTAIPCYLEASAPYESFGDVTLRLINGRNANQNLIVGPLTFLMDAKVTNLNSPIKTVRANGKDRNYVEFTILNHLNEPLSDRTFKIPYQFIASGEDSIDLTNVGSLSHPISTDGFATFRTDTHGKARLEFAYEQRAGGNINASWGTIKYGTPSDAAISTTTFARQLSFKTSLSPLDTHSFGEAPGFPTTGFNGGVFYIFDLPEGRADNYTWHVDDANYTLTEETFYLRVFMGGMYDLNSFITITGTSKTGGMPVVYTFRIQKYFDGDGRLVKHAEAVSYCRNRTTETPHLGELVQGNSIRVIGSLVSEWGANHSWGSLSSALAWSADEDPANPGRIHGANMRTGSWTSSNPTTSNLMQICIRRAPSL